MTHRLTDKRLFIDFMQLGRDLVPESNHNFDCDDMRAAYDLGRAEQLEEVIQWIEYHAEPTRLINDLEEAMRPQENP